MSIVVKLAPVRNPGEIEEDWLGLQESADCSYFQSWGWISTWLVEVAGDLDPDVVRVLDNGYLTGIGIFIRSFRNAAGLFSPRQIFLNEAPFQGRDMFIEYNGLLVEKGKEKEVYKAVIDFLLTDGDWDELRLGLLKKTTGENFVDQISSEIFPSIVKEVDSWQYNSSGLAPGLDGVLGSLSKNRRSQVRKSLRAYETEGGVYVKEAGSAEDALGMFEGLERFHTTRWEARGRRGSFANDIWKTFHHALISCRFSKGEIQLLEVHTEKSVIGYIYSFIWRGCVYVLQTGFNMEVPRGMQPGYISHIETIIHNQKKSINLYDLLSDDTGYKRILCNQSEKLVSLSIKRKNIKSLLRQLSLSNIRNGYVISVVSGILGLGHD